MHLVYSISGPINNKKGKIDIMATFVYVRIVPEYTRVHDVARSDVVLSQQSSRGLIVHWLARVTVIYHVAESSNSRGFSLHSAACVCKYHWTVLYLAYGRGD